MFVNSLGTALPERSFSKAQCWQAFKDSDWFGRLDARSHAVTHLVLTRDNGIERRSLCIESLAEVFAIDPDTLHRRFARHAPRLAGAAGLAALRRADCHLRDIDAVIVTTCTGYLCPGLTGYVIEQLGLRHDVLAFDLVGQGCAGALPNWQLADALLESGRCEHVLSVCVEVCSAAMYLSNDPGVLVSACLFGDGAGAAILSRHPSAGRRRVQWTDSESFIDPAERQALRFEHEAGMLRNILTRRVPELAARRAQQVLGAVLERAGGTQEDISTWIFHAGGRDVLLALESRLGLGPDQLRYSREALRQYGNLSSAFVYFVLDAALEDGAPGGRWWMSSFGAGFTCHGALLDVE